MACWLVILYLLNLISLYQCTETFIQPTNENQCCNDNGCCITLSYQTSYSKKEEVPPEFGGEYFCENMNIIKSDECGDDDLEYYLLPLSSACDLTRAIWRIRWVTQKTDAKGFTKAIVNDDGTIKINNCDELLVSKDDDANPTGFDALKIPTSSSNDDEIQTISVCSQLQWGEIVNKINDEDVQIGFGLSNGDIFSCKNDTVRDICSINVDLADTSSGLSVESNVVHLHEYSTNNNVDNSDDWLYNFMFNFEYYWNKFVGYGIAIFAASIFFNMVMCIYHSGYKRNNSSSIGKECDFTSDDETEEESDDTDKDNEDV